ncbi:hypothetical protein JOF56_000576 [Kibdelosporangium banguiense]|uniref:GH18 domain-containing protein n=1 Tax=Kibdelosporangium banguiense TaxID=1365924 RepID=A0ABS4T6Z2_9PSEU|nr:hypothetical protein [Kibdelosporangium banguiense]MBP2320191.1 hypothetical protein [Kibdelosporangium banguiense]
MKRPWVRHSLTTLGALMMVPLLALTVIVTWLWTQGSGHVPADARGNGSDAMWLGHAWVDGRKTQSDVDALTEHLKQTEIRDLFVHSGPLSPDGSLDPSLRPQAKWLVAAMHRAMPGVRVQAWLGAVVAKDRLNPDNDGIRKLMVASAAQVLDDGFDGVHYDLEPMADGTTGFLRLLESTRELTRARDAVLSVAAHQVEVVPGMRRLGQLMIGKPHWWTTGYLRNVAERVDQVAIMAYDTGVPFETGYSGYVRAQTKKALEAVPSTVALFIGIPAYHSAGPGHTDAETVPAALRGVRLALDGGKPERPFGVAVYIDFEATAQDWAAYRTEWR